jgi:SAM-dependent methyltransferase
MAGTASDPDAREADLASQQAAIKAVCDLRGWKLLELLEDAPSESRANGHEQRERAFEALRRGEADVLVAARHDRLCETRPDLARLLGECRDGGLRVLVIDLWIDTMTDSGRRMADYVADVAQLEVPKLDLPLPPPKLRYRVSGVESEEGFELSGQIHADGFESALESVGHRFEDFGRIYDFGCGCGRLMRHVRLRAPEAQLYGSDIDEPAIAWLRSNIPEADVHVNGWLPPLPHEAGTFDLVLGFSVFTHLDEDYQDAWLAELARVTKPGALLLLTVHGPIAWEWHREGPLMGRPELAQLEAELERRGFLHWRDDGWEQHFPDYYHTTFHLPGYVHRRWGEHFEVLGILEGAAAPTQDVVVLRRPTAESG